MYQDALFSQIILLMSQLLMHLLKRGMKIRIMRNKGLPDDQQAKEDEGDKYPVLHPCTLTPSAVAFQDLVALGQAFERQRVPARRLIQL